jgi:hypothetical protein
MPSHPSAAEPAAVTGTQSTQDIAGLIGRTGAALSSHCRAAHHELQQTQRLLSDATRRLLDCFHAATRNLAVPDHPSGANASATARAEANLLAASQHLQFSDLVGQLLATTDKRVDSLLRVSQCLQSLARAVDTLRTDSAHELDAHKRAFIEALSALEVLVDSGIRQDSMEAGDAELF